MGKFNLGSVSTEVGHKINRHHLFINEPKANPIEKDMEAQFDTIHSSLIHIQELLNRSVNLGVASGKRAEVFRSWAKKAKSQATNAEKMKASLVDKYSADLKNYPIRMLDDRIAELEKKIAGMVE